jgi:hypothetical protein
MWIGMAAKVMKEMFEKMKNIDIVAPTVTLRGSLKKSRHRQPRSLSRRHPRLKHVDGRCIAMH